MNRVTIRTVTLLAGAAISAGLFAAVSQREDSRFAALGEFTDMRFTADHAYGHSVHLARHGDQLSGYIEVAEGPPSDFPAGLLEQVKFDPRTGALAFTARLNLGVILENDGRQTPTRDTVELNGRLRGETLAGTMKWKDAVQPARAARTIPVTLKLRRDSSGDFLTPKTIAAWKQWIDTVLKARGPRW